MTAARARLEEQIPKMRASGKMSIYRVSIEECAYVAQDKCDDDIERDSEQGHDCRSILVGNVSAAKCA